MGQYAHGAILGFECGSYGRFGGGPINITRQYRNNQWIWEITPESSINIRMIPSKKIAISVPDRAAAIGNVSTLRMKHGYPWEKSAMKKSPRGITIDIEQVNFTFFHLKWYKF